MDHSQEIETNSATKLQIHVFNVCTRIKNDDGSNRCLYMITQHDSGLAMHHFLINLGLTLVCFGCL